MVTAHKQCLREWSTAKPVCPNCFADVKAGKREDGTCLPDKARRRTRSTPEVSEDSQTSSRFYASGLDSRLDQSDVAMPLELAPCAGHGERCPANINSATCRAAPFTSPSSRSTIPGTAASPPGANNGRAQHNKLVQLPRGFEADKKEIATANPVKYRQVMETKAAKRAEYREPRGAGHDCGKNCKPDCPGKGSAGKI
ncbi:uncharacterized protein B0I36DRAFT_403591 [Microdochium trichocladiopsis]|uniref:Uncharacterized protein n=1 Tax=Microdochium trichocladiopsis TaxID=1682393 RepID=A0A9P8YC53_9PEZI|nr:uncharacterized protein B0I36DRAFT_403591 [Microdochium trichocladiopsis]KAH7038026.1 hypothetical protein B0I36DRAFT_403591 [Microdochium trichocladiopsis]